MGSVNTISMMLAFKYNYLNRNDGAGRLIMSRLIISLFFTVNDFRKVSLEMMDGHREKLTGNKDNLVGRIEFLPVFWYYAVHDDLPTGVDRCVKLI